MNSKQVFVALCAGSLLYANPDSPTIIEGDVSFDTVGSTLTVSTTSDRSIVDWDSFSIDVSETTDFVFPYAGAAILNRVTGETLSEIAGTLTSHVSSNIGGHVFLINPNGIVFEGTSVVSTGAFLASTLSADNTEFMNGSDMTFLGTDDDIRIENYGSLTATHGDIILLSHSVADWGTDVAPNGNVAHGAGMEVLFQPFQDERISIVGQTVSTPGWTGVEFAGQIEAMAVELKADGNIYQYAINVNGPITAENDYTGASFVKLDAEGGLVSMDNDIVASNFTNAYGANVTILGEAIEMSGNINVSSTYGGGSVFVGGGYQGSGTPYNAENIFVSSISTIDASTISSGEGGLVVVWSDDTTDFSGTVDATSGLVAGEGGVVEISGVSNLYYNGTVDVSGQAGPGTFLMDPQYIEYNPAQREGYTQATPIIY